MVDLNRKHRFLRKPPLKQTKKTTLRKLGIAFVIVILATALYIQIEPHTYDAKQRVLLESKLEQTSKQLDLIRDEYDNHKQETEKDKKKRLEKIKKLNEEVEKTKRELQAKRNAATVYAEEAPEAPPQAPASSTGCNTGNKYKDFIYSHESGCRPEAVNSIGCRGIGQACPGTKLPCGADFACQDAFFTEYAMNRYGSWEAAYNFWLANNWW